MATLLAEFSIGQIILFIILLALAFKGVVEFVKWIRGYVKERVKKEEQPDKLQEQLEQMEQTHCKHIAQLQEKDEKLQKDIDEVASNVKILINSDKAAILDRITQQHHYFMRLGWIDDFSLETVEKRYRYYQEEGGNSFAEDLVMDLRKLPKTPPEVNQN